MTDWWELPALCVDTETTGVDPLEARIVTASAVLIGPDGVEATTSWLADPGIDIPPGATAIHGISTEKARAEGRPAEEVLGELVAVIADHWSTGAPVVIMNAPYDLSLIQAELLRRLMGVLAVGPVLDPLAIDRGLVPNRRGKGARTLTSLAGHYGVQQGAAHTAEGDCLTAGRVLSRQVRTSPSLRAMSLDEMQVWQAKAHRDWADGFGGWLRSVGKVDDVERDWPIRQMAVTA